MTTVPHDDGGFVASLSEALGIDGYADQISAVSGQIVTLNTLVTDEAANSAIVADEVAQLRSEVDALSAGQTSGFSGISTDSLPKVITDSDGFWDLRRQNQDGDFDNYGSNPSFPAAQLEGTAAYVEGPAFVVSDAAGHGLLMSDGSGGTHSIEPVDGVIQLPYSETSPIGQIEIRENDVIGMAQGSGLFLPTVGGPIAVSSGEAFEMAEDGSFSVTEDGTPVVGESS